VFSAYTALDLGVHVVTACIERLRIDPSVIDELYFGTVLLDPRIPNLAREIVLRSGLPKTITGQFISNNCITGLVAANAAREAILGGRIKAAIIGGSESMSTPTLTFPRSGENFFFRLNKARTVGQKLSVATSFRPRFLVPQAPSPKEPSTGLTMGQHCELMAQEFGILRREQDELALVSHQRAFEAKSRGILAEQITAVGGVSEDNLIRAETSLEKLAGLPAVFDRGAKGTISAGNSSALTDGASAVCLMADSFARELGLPIIGYLDGIEFASVPPGDGLLMAPALALPKVMRSVGVKVTDVGAFEIHEAFSAQVLCNMRAWEKGWDRYRDLSPIGSIPRDMMNILGGSIALGHPFAATGGRLLLNTCAAMRASDSQRGLISVCAAGGGAAAAAISIS
jgi:acetyl-CoA acetyltransferase family protein